MNNLYEYIDPIISPYEAFCFDSDATGLPIPAHWHYYVELLYLLEGNVRITIDRVVQTCPPGSVVLFPPRCVHAIGYADRRERVRYHVIKFDPEVLLRSRKEEVDLHASLRNISTSTCPCCFLPEQSAQMNLRPCLRRSCRNMRRRTMPMRRSCGLIFAGSWERYSGAGRKTVIFWQLPIFTPLMSCVLTL